MNLNSIAKVWPISTAYGFLNLLLHGELCGCDIQYVLETSQPNISRHLQYLKNSGLVLDRRDGFRMFYRLAEPHRAKKHLFEFLATRIQGRRAFEERYQEAERRDSARLLHAYVNGGRMRRCSVKCHAKSCSADATCCDEGLIQGTTS